MDKMKLLKWIKINGVIILKVMIKFIKLVIKKIYSTNIEKKIKKKGMVKIKIIKKVELKLELVV